MERLSESCVVAPGVLGGGGEVCGAKIENGMQTGFGKAATLQIHFVSSFSLSCGSFSSIEDSTGTRLSSMG